jgi:signal peptidase I
MPVFETTPNMPAGVLPQPLPAELQGADRSAVANNVAARRSKGALAIGAALAFPGLGHLIAGRPRRAIFWLVALIAGDAAFLMALLTPGWLKISLIMVLPLGLLHVFHWADASWCGKRSTRSLLGEPLLRYLAAFVLAGCGTLIDRGLINTLQARYLELCITPTDSMLPTIVPGDLFLCLKNQSPIHRWDIIGLTDPVNSKVSFCKRVIGLPGDTVEITPAGLLINGELTQPPNGAGPYMACDPDGQPLATASPLAATGCWGNPIRLNHDEYYVLGDNSYVHGDTISWDSRFWPSDEGHQPGALPADQITGKIVAIVSPMTRWRLLEQ